jgi:stage V sporulation protein AC
MASRDRGATRQAHGSTGPGRTSRQEYKKLATARRPPVPVLRNVAAAFLVGGLICVIGQAVLNFFIARGITPPDSGGPTAGVMVTLGALLTGIGVYDRIGEFAGMGSALPITGFANSIVSPAMEFKREGFVLGLGARMFQVAGPVIVYGLVSSFAVVVLRVLLTGKP